MSPGTDLAARRRPTREDLEAARGRIVPDVVRSGLRLLVAGINPGLWTAWTGHHFARPGNRFWAALHRAGITPRVLLPHEQPLLLELGVGVTNMVPRATAAADELTRAELRAGGRRLAALVAEHRPAAVAVLGMGAYRHAYDRPRAVVGRQPEPLGGAPAWVVPNPSGLQARYGVDAIASLLREAWGCDGRGDDASLEGEPPSG